jgi:hypothetical protein
MCQDTTSALSGLTSFAKLQDLLAARSNKGCAEGKMTFEAFEDELPRSKLRGINPPLADSYGPPVWRGKAGVSCVGSACEP